MADLDLTLRGIPVTATDDTVTVGANSRADTAAGDYLLVLTDTDYTPVADLTIDPATGVDAWVLLGEVADSGNNIVARSWLGRVTTGGPRAVVVRTPGGHGTHVHLYTLDPTGGTVTLDGLSPITDRTSPYIHPSLSPTGTRDLLVCFHGQVQFTGTSNYGDPPAGMTGVENYFPGNSFSGMQSAYQVLTAAGATGSRSQTSTPTSLSGGAGMMLALRAQGDDEPTASPASATLAAGSSLTAVAHQIHRVTATLSATSSLLAAGGIARPAAATLTAGSELLIGAPVRAVTPTATLDADSELLVTQPQQVHAATATLHAGSGLDATAWQAHQVTATLTAGSSLTGLAHAAGSRERYAPPKRVAAGPAPPQPTRVIAQDILTGQFLHWDLDVSNLAVTWTLSGPTSISGNFPVEIADLRDLDLTPWGTWIHIEEDGQIRASGILQPAQIDTDETLTLDAAGITTYLHGTPYLGTFQLVGTDPDSGETGVGLGLDPADIVRDMWVEAQSYPDSDLGVFVLGDTSHRVGTPKRTTEFEATDPDSGQSEMVSFESGPYSALDWFEAPDMGSELNKLATDTPFDYLERCAWNADKTGVQHWIEIGYPRLGRKLPEVRFSQEENLLNAVGPEEPEDRYASEVIVLGAGEGTARVRGRAARPVAGRLRRVATVDDKSEKSNTAATARAWHELGLRQALADVSEITALARDDNARLGAYSPGDDVLVAADVPWLGELRLWQRILDVTFSAETEQVKITLRSSSSFDYGGPATS